MTEIQQNRYDQLIRRVSNIVAPGSMVGDALNELFPVIDVENVPGELLALMGTDIAVGATTLTGAAGQAPRIQVFNPAESGKLITVTQVITASSVIDILRVGITNIALTSGVATQIFRDRRKRVTSRPVGAIFQQSSIALSDANMLLPVLANLPIFLRDDNGLAVLSPGSGFEVGSSIFAAKLTVTLLWRERTAEPAELNL